MDELKKVISALDNVGYKTERISIPFKRFYSAEIDGANLTLSVSYTPEELCNSDNEQKEITGASINLDGILVEISLYPTKKATIKTVTKIYDKDKGVIGFLPRVDEGSLKEHIQASIEKAFENVSSNPAQIQNISDLMKELGYDVI
ncbi:MAG: hypothetical protein HZB65_04020 [Candidatus Aenigmarchaeota archaeon]|nr:hypothetical protein [Candidatus Aenigmarchaeota archaeon]